MSRSTAFWDSSALIPLCVQERTSNKVKKLATQFAPVVLWATSVEYTAGLRDCIIAAGWTMPANKLPSTGFPS